MPLITNPARANRSKILFWATRATAVDEFSYDDELVWFGMLITLRVVDPSRSFRDGRRRIYCEVSFGATSS
ncbi:hypothetical protein [Nocardia rosealba]|uniref:hypothetical protein n=1 Tax=Nocardia rosealba TaxID=2878563 RepID=UPI001CDA1F8F|nr:hypothetical protein [Nocardia rosealba]MCA2207267.1 hypothetical protein [Nocardia rosealba]